MNSWQLLIVDDEEMNLEIVSAYLDQGPYTLDLAGSGEEAWERIVRREQPFDLVVLDRMLPGISGLELLKRMRTDPAYARLPVVLQTAAARGEDIADGLAAGAFYYLTKPFMAEDLVSIVEAALHERARDRRFAQALAAAPDEALVAGNEYAFASLAEAERLALRLARLCPQPIAAAAGLAELMENAVEHGIAGIGFAEKQRRLRARCWPAELEQRLARPENSGKQATVSFTRGERELEFSVSDPGSGFDARGFLSLSHDRACAPNGRGIARAHAQAFPGRLRYENGGTRAIATVPLI